MKINWSEFKAICLLKNISMQLERNTGAYYLAAYDGVQKISCSILKTDPASSDQAEFEATYLPLVNLKSNIVDVSKLPAFAAPTYRTKRNATSGITTVQPNSDQLISHVLTEERYAAGGTLLIKNAEFGDYFEAYISDPQNLIPEPARASVCENVADYPILAKYVEKEFVEVNQGNISIHRVETVPLNARISAGLAVQIKYFAVNAGSAREVALNFNLTKKLS